MRKTLRILYFLPLTAVLLWACGPGGSAFRIKGSFRDMQAGELYIYNLSASNARFDTITVRDGEFSYKGQVDETTPYILVFPNGMEQVIFVGQGQELTYEATANDLRNYVVNGNDENKLMNKFRQETYTYNPTMMLDVAKKYITENAESPVAVFLFDYYFVQNDQASDTETSSVLKILKTKQPDNRYLREVETKLTMAARSEAGNKLPDATLTKRDKTTKKLWATQKDFNIFAFWASWAPSGYETCWRLRQINDDYKSEGKVRIAAISLDIERFRWEDSVRPDSTNGIEHYCDDLGFESPAIKALGINSVPYFILTDRSHKILSTSQDINQFKSELSKYIK